jgi:hypothetical protein
MEFKVDVIFITNYVPATKSGHPLLELLIFSE